MTQINDIITDEIGSVYAETAIWCNENNAFLEEIEPEGSVRRFQVKAIPEHVPTLKEQKVKRAQAYLLEVDPITAHIQRERDEAEPDEEKIAALIAERAAKVEEIKARYPYPEESEAGDGEA